MDTHAHFGVLEYWIVNPVANTLEIYRLDSSRYVLACSCGSAESAASTLPGLTITGARLFAD